MDKASTPAGNAKLLTWVAEMQPRFRPEQIVWVDGSQAAHDRPDAALRGHRSTAGRIAPR